VDLHGNKKEKSIPKHELIHNLKLAMRDLRTVDVSTLPPGLQSSPSILVREGAIIINMLVSTCE
jgi:hypothetical protein